MNPNRGKDRITPAALACVAATACHLWHQPLWASAADVACGLAALCCVWLGGRVSRLWPRMAGVLLVEATKVVEARINGGKARRVLAYARA